MVLFSDYENIEDISFLFSSLAQISLNVDCNYYFVPKNCHSFGVSNMIFCCKCDT